MTVEELKRRMSVEELMSWRAYVREMGPLNLAWRIDYAVACSAIRFLGGKLRDIMPYPVQEEREATPEDVISLLKFAQKPQEK